MSKLFKYALLAPALFMICANIVAGNSSPALASDSDKDFELYDLDGALYDLQRIRKSKGTRLIVVDFFEVSCDPCRKALPEWSKLHAELSKKGFSIVVVALPGPEDRATAENKLFSYFKKNPVPFPVVFDKYKKVAKQYNVVKDGKATLPQAFLLSEKGKILAEGRGPEDFEARLRAELKTGKK